MMMSTTFCYVHQMLTTKNLKYYHPPERTVKGGRVAIIYDKKYNTMHLDAREAHTFQYTRWKYQSFKPPNVANLLFLDEILEWIANSIAMDPNIIIAGDFNLHVNNPNDDDGCNFINAHDCPRSKTTHTVPYPQVR